ncbi:hypothetical protein FOA52_014380 [Chlamydomonas sp. UWO 241]|nr:hypothetical protein FOA52_014380 [Chlamydomonas sp. UWO 241]
MTVLEHWGDGKYSGESVRLGEDGQGEEDEGGGGDVYDLPPLAPTRVPRILIDDVHAEERMEEEVCIHAKWMLDACETLDECIERLEATKAEYRSYQDDGYELNGPIGDDYGFLELC